MHVPPPTSEPSPFAKARTGIEGLDRILGGGLPLHRLCLLEGMPGTGKTTFALRFLRAGVEAGERTLYVTLSENRLGVRRPAAAAPCA